MWLAFLFLALYMLYITCVHMYNLYSVKILPTRNFERSAKKCIFCHFVLTLSRSGEKLNTDLQQLSECCLSAVK